MPTKTTEKKKTAPKAAEVKKTEKKSDKFAVIRTGGKQYLVYEGKKYDFEKIKGDEGKEVKLEEVLLVANGKDVKVGTPKVSSAVTGKVISQKKDDKVTVFKYKKRKRYRKTQGHRQQKTAVEITKIG